MKKISGLILKLRKWIIGITILLTLVMAYFLKGLQVDPDIFNYLPENDPKAELFREVGRDYGGNYLGIIALRAPEVFDPVVLEHVRRITDTLRNVPGIGSVTSLTNVIDIRGSEWGIEIGKLIDSRHLPDNPAELDSLKRYTLSDDMYRGSLVSEDATLTTIMVRIAEGADKMATAREIRQIISGMGLPEEILYGGLPFVFISLSDIIRDDLLFLAPVTALVIMLILFLSFRNARGVILPLITVLIGMIWTIGLMGLLNIPLTIISDVIPVILLAVGSAYTIHVLNRIAVPGILKDREKMKEELAYIIIPVFLAAATTMAGFISFIFGSYLMMISTFGIFMAVGVLIVFLLSVTFAPAVVAQFPGKAMRENRPGIRPPDLFDRFLASLNGWVLRKPGTVVLWWTGIALVAVSGIFLIQRKVDVIGYFKPNDPSYQAEMTLREKFGGAAPVYVVVKGDIMEPETLRALEQQAEYLESTGKVIHAQSVADLIRKMNDVMGEGKVIPDDRSKVEQLWFLLQGQEVLEQLVNDDLDEAVINCTFNDGETEAMEKFVSDYEQYLRQHPSSAAQIDFTGLPSLYIRIDRSLLNSQMQSLAYATLLVMILVAFILGSLRKGLLVIIPILLTLSVLFGVMGWARISLDIVSVLVGSVSIGIGVDYSIHMITHLHHEMRKGRTLEEAVSRSVVISGRAILTNVLSVALGFLVLVLSDLVPLQKFGLLVATTMVTSGLAAMTALPAIMILIDKRKSARLQHKDKQLINS